MVFEITAALAIGFPQQADQEARQIIDSFRQKVTQAETITVTEIRFDSIRPEQKVTRWWYRRGGYLRRELERWLTIETPKTSWSLNLKEKTYRERARTDDIQATLEDKMGLGHVGNPFSYHPVSAPQIGEWDGQKALSISVIEPKTYGKSPLTLYFDSSTKDQIGASIQRGRTTYTHLFENLMFNAKLDDSLFRFVPSKEWKRLDSQE